MPIHNIGTDPDLLLDTVGNDAFLKVNDILLGFMKFGAATAHWIQSKGDRQLSHVDYPMHVGSGPFWQGSADVMKRYTTNYQVSNDRVLAV